MQHGSLQNLLMSRAKVTATPEVGMGVTEVCWTDRHAYTVTEVKGPREIVVQRDRAIRTDANGMSDAQAYRFEADPAGSTRTLTLRRNGKWLPVGESSKATGWLIGSRSEYYDYSF